jgi:hypothetical protein
MSALDEIAWGNRTASRESYQLSMPDGGPDA